MRLFNFRSKKPKDDGQPAAQDDRTSAPDATATATATATAATDHAANVPAQTGASDEQTQPAAIRPAFAPPPAAPATTAADSSAGFSSRPGLIARLRAKLNRGNSWLTYDLANLLPGGKIDENVLDELETRLIAADVGIETTDKILGSLRKRVQRKELSDLNALLGALRSAMLEILVPVAQPLVIDTAHKPYVVLVVGVNGSGKTTTIGKLARRFTSEGRKVMLAAGDTFRAAAIEQLQVWGERNNVPVIAQAAGADPAAVTFDALQSAQARGCDVLVGDTAGRLHTQSNLMDELKKVKRVLTRLDASAPHEVLLVLDASQGQNALAQAQQFHQAVGVTGLVMTKLDGTAKGGIVLAIADALRLPIRYIGVGETAEDFSVFDAAAFVEAVLAPSRTAGGAAA
jgi:fused signal recognition particle receptor